MTKLPHGKGGYYQRKGRNGWQIKFPLGWSDRTKRYEVYNEDFETQAEAIAALKEINAFVFHGGEPRNIPRLRHKKTEAPTVSTLKEFAESYCHIREAQHNVDDRTVASDRECLKRVMPYIGNVPLDRVTSQQIDEMYAAMRSSGKENKNGHAYSGTTLVRTHATLSKLFSRAIDYGIRDDNPCDKATKPKNDTPEKTPLTKQQVQELYSVLTNKPLTAKSVGLLIALFCGLRLSELLALAWSDYQAGSISVTKALKKNEQLVKKPKNGESRVVPCPPPLVPILEIWREQQQAWYASQGLKWSLSSPIVNSSTGGHFLQSSFSRWFAHARLNLPIPDDFVLHGFRHTYITLISRDCGIDERTVRDISGHKSSEAFQVYTHTNREWTTEAARRFGVIVAPGQLDAICQHCEYWIPSPSDQTIGACWCNVSETIPVISAATECVTNSFVPRNYTPSTQFDG